jgi:hypothetical protein
MAGQSPEPSFQPSGQDQGLTQGRPAWQQSAYPPPGGSAGGQAYAAPSYSAQDQGYADQTYTVGQGAGQDYPGYQGPSYGAQSGTGTPQWQGSAGATPGASRVRSAGDRGFLSSLFDFSFTSMVTPKIIKVLYILAVVWAALVALIYVIVGFSFGGFAGGLVVLVIVAPIILLLSIGISRVVLETFSVAFKIHEELVTIREQGENRS